MFKHKLFDGKILIKGEATFEKVQTMLLDQGYKWLKAGNLETKDLVIHSLFFYADGSIKHSTLKENDLDWMKHANKEYVIKNDLLTLAKTWERGDPGPAPVDYIFEGTAPTPEEAPGGYLMSACKTKFQRVEACFFMGGVGIVLEPDTTKIEAIIEVKKNGS